ncbi:MAG TPA: tRNA uridine-5-carboxymethylaminomethyl(34) synthesis GTPase MnmE [Kofleriaceae bacterium]
MDGETIAAIATPPGSGGIGVVRVSGPEAVSVVARLVGREAHDLPDRTLVHAVARDPASGERLDEVLVAVMRAPRSYTGEDVAEVHGHGGPVNMGRLLRAALSAGARAAEPGEFTRRAVARGRMDLVQAEAVLGVIAAASERALRLAQGQLEGRLGERVAELRQGATELLADLEASIDFPDEGLEHAARTALGARAAVLGRACASLADSFAVGRALSEGLDVALVGPVNAGKSSLFNRLVGSERALVAEEPGTTRDYVEARVVWQGIPVTLVDTAGWREAGGVERRGIELGTERAERADVRVELIPAEMAKEARDQAPDTGRRTQEAGRTVRVVSKGDRLTGDAGGLLVTSSVSGAGIEELKAAIVGALGAVGEEGVVVTSERQRDLVARSAAALVRAASAAQAGHAEEVLALEVREASQALAAVLGEEVGDDMLDALFARFCIGK